MDEGEGAGGKFLLLRWASKGWRMVDGEWHCVFATGLRLGFLCTIRLVV